MEPFAHPLPSARHVQPSPRPCSGAKRSLTPFLSLLEHTIMNQSRLRIKMSMALVVLTAPFLIGQGACPAGPATISQGDICLIDPFSPVCPAGICMNNPNHPSCGPVDDDGITLSPPSAPSIDGEWLISEATSNQSSGVVYTINNGELVTITVPYTWGDGFSLYTVDGEWHVHNPYWGISDYPRYRYSCDIEYDNDDFTMIIYSSFQELRDVDGSYTIIHTDDTLRYLGRFVDQDTIRGDFEGETTSNDGTTDTDTSQFTMTR